MPEIIGAIAWRAGTLMLRIIPAVLVGAGIGALLQRHRFASLLQHLGRLPATPLIMACALIGAASPFCTFGTVPVVIGLWSGGFPLAAGISFLAASSIVNPQMLLLQAATVGPIFSIWQGVAGIGIGIGAGMAVRFCEKRGIQVVNPAVLAEGGDREPEKPRSFWRLFLGQLDFVLIYVMAGILIAAVFEALNPAPFGSFSKDAGVWTVLFGAVASVPLYVCGGGCMPVMGTLLAQGFPPGMVLAFIIAGPATRIQALAAVKSLLDRKALAGYILWVLAVAALMGWAANLMSFGQANWAGLQ